MRPPGMAFIGTRRYGFMPSPRWQRTAAPPSCEAATPGRLDQGTPAPLGRGRASPGSFRPPSGTEARQILGIREGAHRQGVRLAGAAQSIEGGRAEPFARTPDRSLGNPKAADACGNQALDPALEVRALRVDDGDAPEHAARALDHA